MSKSDQNICGNCQPKTNRAPILISLMSLFLLTGGCSRNVQDDKETKSAQKDAAIPEAHTGLPAKVSATEGIKLFTEPGVSKSEIKTLPMNTVVWVLEEINVPGKGHWYRLKTRSGMDGWAQGQINLCSVQESEHLISLDRKAFEKKLSGMILDAAVKQISQEKPHSPSYLVSKVITSPLASDGGNSYSVNVSCMMVGKFLGKTRSRLDVKVDLFLDIDEDLLISSNSRIKNVAIVSEQEGAEPIPVAEKISLLKNI